MRKVDTTREYNTLVEMTANITKDQVDERADVFSKIYGYDVGRMLEVCARYAWMDSNYRMIKELLKVSLELCRAKEVEELVYVKERIEVSIGKRIANLRKTSTMGYQCCLDSMVVI